MITRIIIVLFLSQIFTSCAHKNKPIKIFDVHLHGAKNPAQQIGLVFNASVYKAAISSSW